MSKLKIAFLGIPDFVKPIREVIGKNFTLVESLNEADLGVVAAYGQILTRDELETPKYGCLNVHPSFLPKLRGSSPIQAAILNGEKKSGITIIKMDEEIDHGSIIYQEQLELSDDDNFDTLSKKMFLKASQILPQIITDFISGKISPAPQDHSQATFCGRLTKQSGYFNINNPPSSEVLDSMIRAYFPWPGVWCKFKVQNAKLKIVKLLPGGLLQMEGKKAISFKDFLNGYPDFPIKQLQAD